MDEQTNKEPKITFTVPRSIRITMTGGINGTRVFDAATGEKIDRVTSLRLEHLSYNETPKAYLTFSCVQAEIDNIEAVPVYDVLDEYGQPITVAESQAPAKPTWFDRLKSWMGVADA